MTATSSPLPPYREVYDRIKAAGLPAALIKKVLLPSWWEKDAEKIPAACQEAYLEIAAKLGIPYQNLVDFRTPLNLAENTPRVAFKTGRKGKKEQQLAPSAHIGVRLAQIIAKAYRKSVNYMPFSRQKAEESRNDILTGASWVSFSPLLDYCWRKGIPVIHWKGEKGQAFDGMATVMDDVPVIILGSGKNTAWACFHLAHELGHIMLGHIQNQEMALDNELNQTNDEKESKEAQADAFAKELLYGGDKAPKANLNITSGDLRHLAERNRISPASILLYNCWATGKSEDYQALNARLKRMRSVYVTRDKVNELLRSKIGQDFETGLMDWQQEFHETLLS